MSDIHRYKFGYSSKVAEEYDRIFRKKNAIRKQKATDLDENKQAQDVQKVEERTRDEDKEG